MADKQTGQPCAIILTAIRDEYKAVRSHLSQLVEDTHPRGSIYECGIFPAEKLTWKVVIMEIGAGNTPPAVEAERAIERFDPELMFFVGVAGGLKDVALGDVVVATKVYSYESGKADKNFLPRPGIGLTSYSLERRARAEGWKNVWLQRLGAFIPDPSPKVFIAPIAAGEKVVSSTRSEIYELLRTNYGDALAVEMEGYGFLQAAHVNEQVHAIVIRGISDLIDDKKEADAANYQELAARHASAFAFEILAKFDPRLNRDKNFEDITRAQRDIKDFKDKVDGKWNTGNDLSQSNQFSESDENVRKNERISERLKKERAIVTFIPEFEAKNEPTELPKTEEAFTDWYYKLGDYEQYYVLTTAVLHGAPVREVVTYTDRLYQLIQKEVEQLIEKEVERRRDFARYTSHNGDQPQTDLKEAERFADPILRVVSGKELQRETFTKTRKKAGIECLYWQDADQYGLSTFGLKLLEFLCKEYIGKGKLGQFFLDALERWSEEGVGEVSRTADQYANKDIEEEKINDVTRKMIHSYGVVLWSHDATTLRRKAKSWALENKPISTAELLDGAYEIYQVKSDEVSEVGASPVVLSLLKKWVRHIHKILDEFEFEENKPKDHLRGEGSKETGKDTRTDENQAVQKALPQHKNDHPADENQAVQKALPQHKNDHPADENQAVQKALPQHKNDHPADENTLNRNNQDHDTNQNRSDKNAEGKNTGEKPTQIEDSDIDDEEFSKKESTPEAAIKLACAVASTYALIGKRSPEIALDGLEELLKLPFNNVAIQLKDTSKIFAYGLSTYVMLAWSGHVRDILEHLATSAAQLSHSRQLPRDPKKRYEYRRKRAVYLDVILEAFFLVAAAASTDVQNIEDAQYRLNEPLLDQPPIPDTDGRDVLLAFLLSRSEVSCRGFITTLLCASIVERKSKYAFGLLRYWAEIVLQLQNLDVADAEEMYIDFREFIVKLGGTVEGWCFDLKQQKQNPPPAFETFKQRLKQWCIEGSFYSHPIGNLAEDILWQLGE